MTKVVDPTNEMAMSEKFKKAMQAEVTGLEKKKTWRVVRKESLPPRPSILGGRFVLNLKTFGTAEELPKAGYVAQGHRDLDK